MTNYKTWDIILVPFPFTNLRSSKKRPALIISPDAYNIGRDMIILFITSNLASFGRTGDYKIEDWKRSGLPKPSMIRMKFATIEKSIILKKLGSLTGKDRKAVKKSLASFFDM
jgi:mRNA interferase MazF